jgi:UDP-N-acetylmuramoyl-L-alanyl-D-glutamate--2,6-diaminopimelate ligase
MAAARVAAASNGWPARKLKIILISGQDGAQLSVAYLASIITANNQRVGVITQGYVEIAGERNTGSDQADLLSDSFRLNRLLAQMKHAGCSHVIIEIPLTIPPHQFTGLHPALLAIRRCGDSHLSGPGNIQKIAHVRRLLGLGPTAVVFNRDDPAFDALKDNLRAGPQLMTFGTHSRAECQIQQVSLHPTGSDMRLVIDHQTELNISINLSGKQAVYSAITAAASAYLLHLPITAIEDGIRQVSDQASYLQAIKTDRPYQLVIDGAVTPEGIAENLETLVHFARNRVLAVVGASLAQPEAWRPVVGEVVARMADRIIVTDGDYAAHEAPHVVRQGLLQGVLAAGGDARCEEVGDRQVAIGRAMSIARRGDVVVVLCSPKRPYRQVGDDRLRWDDREVVNDLI